MPTPKKNERQEDFISRCIPIVKEEDPSLTNEQAAGKCYGMWDQYKKNSKSQKLLSEFAKELNKNG